MNTPNYKLKSYSKLKKQTVKLKAGMWEYELREAELIANYVVMMFYICANSYADCVIIMC